MFYLFFRIKILSEIIAYLLIIFIHNCPLFVCIYVMLYIYHDIILCLVNEDYNSRMEKQIKHSTNFFDTF
jgi:hypothetical protein